MPPLRELQHRFADGLVDEHLAVAPHVAQDEFSAAERLGIYRNSCRSVLTESLRMTYPAIDRLVGREFFDVAAGQFIATQPPSSGYLNEYGGEFADLLAALPAAASFPYLPDVARFEWALNLAANADDAPALDLAALAGIPRDMHAALRFEPQPSVRLLELQYQADAVADAVLAGDDGAMAAIDLASSPVRLVVNRGPHGVDARRLTPGGYAFARRLFGGQRLSEVLELAGAEGAMLLADHFINGRLAGFRVAADREKAPRS